MMNNIKIDLKYNKTTEIIFENTLKWAENFNFNNKKVAIYGTKKAENFVNDLINVLKNRNIDVFSYLTTDGESVKQLKKCLLFCDFLSLNNFSREDLIINVGGGTITDSGSFVASIYMRGIDYINIPTTLLCATDACIGGKTAVDTGSGKNLIGTFYQPLKVIIDSDLIKNSGEEALSGGISEIVKYGIINKDFGKFLSGLKKEQIFNENLDDVILECLKIKGYFVEKDERDENIRHYLNLGHTIAHSLEIASNYTLSHAEAVSMGLYHETLLSFKSGLLSFENYNNIIDFCNKFLNNKEIDVLNLLCYMEKDKKNKQGKIAFSLPTDNGIKICYYTKEELIDIFSK